FLVAAFRKSWRPTVATTAMISAALAIASVVFFFVMPMVGVFVIIYSPLAAWALSTLVLAKVLTRMVVIIRPDAHMVCIDEQKWWKEEEIAVPDAVKREFKGRRVAFLYHVYGPEEGIEGENSRLVFK